MVRQAKADFAATDTMSVPGCWDVLPKWYLKRGTGSYRRTFTLDAPFRDGVLVVDGMGIHARYPEKPIMVSESGCGGLYGMHVHSADQMSEHDWHSLHCGCGRANHLD